MKTILMTLLIMSTFLLSACTGGGLLNDNREDNRVAGELDAAETEIMIPTNEASLLVGGDRDEYGCIGSAGYSWCTPKNKCLRLWEEECYLNLEEEIQYLLADKYQQAADGIKVNVTKQNDNHAAGQVLFSASGVGEGGLFLAVREDNVWLLVFDGNGSVDCRQLHQDYGFTDEILQPEFCN